MPVSGSPYKDQLHLQLGVGLSAEQMAALTHDIVWLEEVEVNGEKVLAPVVYLAQAEGRLAPNGALTQGRDVKLVSGGDLHNVGTLRARNDLSATADNLDNSGLIEAGKRLDLLAGDSIRNRQGGVIAGRDVSLTALTGDVINERSVTRYDSALDGRTWERSFADSAARVEAANSLNVQAGRDIANLGGVLQSRGDLSLDAGRDVTVAAVEDRQGQTRWNTSRLQSVTQLGAEVSAGRDLNVSAGRDLSAVASALEARRDIALSAGRDVTLAAAANEEHAYSKTRKVTYQEDKVAQQGTRVDAGGDLAINAGQDLRLIASQASAGDEAYLVAGDKLELLAANDSNYYLYDKKKKGDFGRKETRRDEVTDVKAVGSQISSGGDLTLLSGGDQTYQGAKLESGNDLAIVSGGAVTFEAVKDLHQESHEKSKGDLAWQSSKGKGQTDETVRQSQIVAQGYLAIKAVEGLKIDVKHIDQKTVSETIDVMVKADPSLAWLREAEKQGDVDWRKVREVHDSFKYSHSGLGVGAQLAVAIVVTYLTAGAASAAIGSAAGATAGSGTAMAAGTAATATTAATSAGWANIALTAAATSAASQTAISTINNRGDLGAVAKDVTSSDALKNYAAAGISAGYSPQNIGLQLSVNAALKTVTRGGSFKDNLGQAAIDMIADAVSGAIYNEVGDALTGTGIPTKVAVHALVGGLMAEAAGGDFRTGALAAGANEAVVAAFGEKIFPGEQHEKLLGMTSNLIGMTVAAAAGGDEKAQEKAGWVAQQATLNNYLFHEEMEEMANKIKACGGDQNCEQPIREHYADLDEQRNKAFPELCRANLTSCVQIANSLSAEEKLNVDLMESLRNAQYNGIAGAIGIAFIPSNRVSADQATLEYVRQTGGTAEEFKAVLAMLGAGGAGVGPKTVEKATKALDRLKALQAAKGTVPAEVPATSVIAKEGLYNELRAAQARDALIGTTLPGAKAPVTVTAEGSVGGKVLVDTNQTARPAMVAENKPTLIADLLPLGSPNSSMANAHAEIAVIQRAFDAGITKGQDMAIIVRGERVCSFCRSSNNILAAADRSGLNSLKLVEAESGKIFTWTRGIEGWK
ncbi:TPA: DUF637 domain-containing protein [Pseudomonas aeruginosa]|nr:DUF637 domain-containing protein [Pseudomonas aeruginosa]HCH7800624.1 DUF637 domain-containing protein [Pseudomonas aeruginosa]HCI4165951.1 DUF637 domain-containing protein [Pseudomonas aeruginosa]HCI7161511.1 DUF637 domain-containing protein [Pseudomonas aeruginosa]HCJ0749678.1 DUF637 domain-containing protein [Pseudomonas aeruginosa]